MKSSASNPFAFFAPFLVVFILSVLTACSTSNMQSGSTGSSGTIAGEQVTIQTNAIIFLATGRTTGHVSDIWYQNTTGQPVVITLPPGLLVSPEDYQSLVFPHPVTISIPPNSEVTTPVTGGLCVDISKPAPPAGTTLIYLGPDDFGPQPTPISVLDTMPGFTPREDLTSTALVPKIPGYEYPLAYTVDLEEGLTAAAPILVEAAQVLDSVYQEMKREGNIETPLPEEVEDESVLQQTFWCFSSALTGNDYKKVDLEENLKKDFEQQNGVPLDAVPEPVQESFREGVDQLWDHTFIPLGERAQLFNPASIWEGVDQILWIETGPGGGTYSLPDNSAAITFPSGLDQPVSGTFFSRTYAVPGLESYGFFPDQPLESAPAPRISFLPSDVATTLSRRIWPDSTFRDLPASLPEGNVSIPIAPSEVLRSPVSAPCVIPPEALEAPPTPEGYEYVGREVVINYRYKTESSSVPLERPTSPDDLVILKSGTLVRDGVCICDWIVTHLYQPINSRRVICPVPPEMLQIPDSPPEPGLRYVGRTVVVNFAVRPELTTTPSTRRPQPGDQSHIRSRTFLRDGVQCDVIVEFLYEKE